MVQPQKLSSITSIFFTKTFCPTAQFHRSSSTPQSTQLKMISIAHLSYTEVAVKAPDNPCGAQMWTSQAKSTSPLCQNTTVKICLQCVTMKPKCLFSYSRTVGSAPSTVTLSYTGEPRGVLRPDWVENHLGSRVYPGQRSQKTQWVAAHRFLQGALVLWGVHPIQAPSLNTDTVHNILVTFPQATPYTDIHFWQSKTHK